jgi:hypothetical protein
VTEPRFGTLHATAGAGGSSRTSGVVVVVARCAGGWAALVGSPVSSGYAFHNGSALGRGRSAATADPAQATPSEATSAGP